MNKPPSQERKALAFACDLLCAALAACALLMDMNLRSGNNYTNWWVSLPNPFLTTLAASAVFFLFRCARRALPPPWMAERLLALFFGAWWVLAQSVQNTADLVQPFLSGGQTLKTLVTALGMACVYDLLIRGLAKLLCEDVDCPAPRETALLRLYRAHTQALCAGILLVCWAPQMIVSYPVNMNSDTFAQLRQALGVYPLYANAPVFGTLLFRLFLRIGTALFSSAAGGLTLYMAIQGVAAAMILGYAQAILRRLCAPRWLRSIFLLVCCFGHVYAGNAFVLLKDVPYTYALVLLVCELLRSELVEGEAYAHSAGHRLRFWGAAVVMLLIRNNGSFVLLPVAAFYFARALKNRRSLRNALIAFLPPLAVFFGFTLAVNAAPDIQPVSIREGLSLPFQQTARYVYEHGGEIPQEEREVIDRVLDYDLLPERYDPMISDPVKWMCPVDATPADVLPYLRVWARQFFRDPVTHLQATLIQNSLLFDPQTFNLAVFHAANLNQSTKDLLHLTAPRFSVQASARLGQISALLYGLPFYLTLNTLGFYDILLLSCIVIAVRYRARGMGALFLLLLLSLVVILLGPCIENQDRYGFCIIYCMPLVLARLRAALRQARGTAGKTALSS